MAGDTKQFWNLSFYFIALLMLAVMAFWQPYFSHLLGGFSDESPGISRYKHIHVMMSVLWLTLLITQPFLIRSNNRTLHGHHDVICL